MGNEGFYRETAYKSSADETWSTPKAFFEKCNEEFNFVLDAAALQSSALCDNWYGPDHPDESRRDAFTRNWAEDADGGTIWLNPPYSRSVKKWLEKADFEASRGGKIVLLVPSRTDTSWFHDYCLKHEVRYLRGRLKFNNSMSNAPFPSALVVMGGKNV